MRVVFTRSFKKDYQSLPPTIQARLDRQLVLLVVDPKHHSLRLKKMQGHPDIWEIRVTKNYPCTLHRQDDLWIIRRAGTHNILRTP